MRRALRERICESFGAILVILLVSCGAWAQSAPSSAFGSPAERDAPPPPITAPQGAGQAAKISPRGDTPFAAVVGWIAQMQQSMQRQLAVAVKNLKSGNAIGAGLLLAGLSFVYGVVHAAGPGHGKAIISAYVLANEETVRRGILISFLAAMIQAFTAVILVGLLLLGLNATGFQVNAWVKQLETVSYGLVFLVGFYLLVTEIVRLWRRRRLAVGHVHHHHHDDVHDHHDHEHHEDCEACHHMVDARTLTGPVSWRKMAAVAMSVGIRPCSGAVLVLIFALTQGLFWAGVAATFAMAVGTAITIAVLATLALGSRELALRLGGGNTRWADAVWSTCAIGGALFVMMIGLLLVAASLGPARPF
jgi:nickel/cobalt exporter